MTQTVKQTHIKYLEANNFIVSSMDLTNIKYVCQYGHDTKLTLTSFINKKSKMKDTPQHLCSECLNRVTLEECRKELQASSKHRIIAYHNKENVDFECNNCGAIKKSTKKSLLVSSCCNACQNHQNRKPYHEIFREVEAKGMVILTTRDQYKDNKSICVKCCCGAEWTVSLNDIKRGRRCMKCRGSRLDEAFNKQVMRINT